MGPNEDDVRVHNDHDSSSAGMIVHPRTSGTSELRPVPTNRLEIVPSPQPGVSSVPTAVWRMRRTLFLHAATMEFGPTVDRTRFTPSSYTVTCVIIVALLFTGTLPLI